MRKNSVKKDGVDDSNQQKTGQRSVLNIESWKDVLQLTHVCQTEPPGEAGFETEVA